MSSAVLPPIRREELPPGEILCDHCTALCCRYFAVKLETPESAQDFDMLRWILLHEPATLFTEDEEWYLMVHEKCKHLQSDHRCGAYDSRPQVCRDYTTETCEYGDSHVYDRYFETAEQLDEYAEAVLSAAEGTVRRSPKPPLLPVLG